jgi:hypothetical protein
MSRPCAASARATARSCDDSRSACSRHTATASTSATAGTWPSNASTSEPDASIRPLTSNRAARGTNGGGRSTCWL